MISDILEWPAKLLIAICTLIAIVICVGIICGVIPSNATQCTQCGAAISDRICGSCLSETIPQVECPYCGETTEFAYCHACGRYLS